MTDEQRRWTNSKCIELDKYIRNNFPLSDAQWESVITYIERIVGMAKENNEVRQALFDIADKWQLKEKQEVLPFRWRDF